MKLSPAEIQHLEAYFQTTFNNQRLTLRSRSQTPDSAEVLLNGEFIGVVYKDEDEGETSYNFSMAILEIDLPQTAKR